MLGDIAPPPRERLETPTMSLPPGFHQILAVCSSLASGCTRRCPFVVVGTRGGSSMVVVMGPRGRSSIVIVGGRSHLSILVVGPRRDSILVMGPRGRSSILVVGPVDVHQPLLPFLDPGGGSSSMVVVSAHCVSWGL